MALATRENKPDDNGRAIWENPTMSGVIRAGNRGTNR